MTNSTKRSGPPNPPKPIDLSAWRLHHAKLTQREAADRAGITQRHASSIESRPPNATLGALRAYVEACGGRLEIVLELGGVRRLLMLLATLLTLGCSSPVEGWQDTAELVAS